MSETLPPTKRLLTRQLRERKQRKLYSDEWALGDDEADGGGRGFSLADKLESSRFEHPGGVKEMHGSDLTVGHLQKNGFNTPLLFKEKTGLGLRVPTTNFTIKDVRMCVGSHRLLDVMDVNTQKNTEMTMKDWQRYYEDPHKERLLNVISLEFSHTRLENYVTAPRVVRQLDWVDTVWPRYLKDQQTESTNLIEDMKYPKVQKYCLMSVKGCYTDFHIDFGGTSVWYHILKGAKVFWLIPPTEANLLLYEKWVLSGKQSDVFFGDTVEKCIRVHLLAGNTFFIPTGWIHAVYTPSDSLVFGGNFLHQFGIEKQLKIAQVEDTTKVPQKFRYPFFTEMLWYALERYVHELLGRTHLTIDEIDSTKPKEELGEDGNASKPVEPKEKVEEKDKKHLHLTQVELHGLKAIVMYLHLLPANRKNVPELLGDPISLIKDVRSVVEQHRHDNMEKAVTGIPILRAPEEVLPCCDKKRRLCGSECYSRTGKIGRPPKPALAPPDRPDKTKVPRRRRTRCKKCEACQRSDCGECVFCHDMVKFGGLGRAKQTCNMRQCLQPMLPITAACGVCQLDGWHQTPVAPQAKGNSVSTGRTGLSALMECAVCYAIVHPSCVPPGGQVNEDLPNSWECPNCTNLGLNHDYKPRHFRARQKSSDLRRLSSCSDMTARSSSGGHKRDSGGDIKTEASFQNGSFKSEDDENAKPDPLALLPPKKRRSSEEVNTDVAITATPTGVGGGGSLPSTPAPSSPGKLAFRAQLAQLLCSNSTKSLRKPMMVVRPASGASHASGGANVPDADDPSLPPWLRRKAILPVFTHLTPSELANCALVCKTWAKYSIEPCLWRSMSLLQVRVSAAQLAGIARRQPQALGIEWCQVARRQLEWLVARLPALRTLSLAGSGADAALALRASSCPPLVMLDLSFARGLDDARVRALLSPGASSGVSNAVTKDAQRPLRQLRILKVPGTNIGDVAMRYVVQWLPLLTELDASTCSNLTDAGAAQLASAEALERVSLAGCRKITEAALDHLAKCPQLVRLDLRHVPLVSTQAVIKFAAKSKHNLQVKDVKLVDRRKT